MRSAVDTAAKGFKRPHFNDYQQMPMQGSQDYNYMFPPPPSNLGEPLDYDYYQRQAMTPPEPDNFITQGRKQLRKVEMPPTQPPVGQEDSSHNPILMGKKMLRKVETVAEDDAAGEGREGGEGKEGEGPVWKIQLKRVETMKEKEDADLREI